MDFRRPTRGERRQEIDELMEQRNEMVRAFMERYSDIDRDEIQKKVDASLDRGGREFDRMKGR